MTTQQAQSPRAPLEVWLFNQRKTPTEFARSNKISQSALSKALLPPDADGFQEAGIKLRKKVRRATGGAIGIADWPEAPETPIGEPGSPPTGDRQSTSEGAPQILASALPSEAFSHT